MVFTSLVFVALASFLLFGGQGKPAGWKGEITTENGVRVVRNPGDPLFGEFAFDLEENLRIGGDPTAESYYFPKWASVRPDDKGNLYVADVGNARVQMYDPEGKFVRTIGRRGQGPGEYMTPLQVFFDGGNIYVFGTQEIILFAPDAVFIKKINVRTFLGWRSLGPRGSIIGITQPSPRDGWKQNLVQIDLEGMTTKTIAEYRGEAADSTKGMVLHWYSSQVAFTRLTVDTFAYGYSTEYKIQIADAKGRTIVVITKGDKSIPISNKEKDATRKEGYFAWYGPIKNPQNDIIFPSRRPYFSYLHGFKNDDQGRLYVVRCGSILERNGPQTVDVFSKEGIYLYRMRWPFVPGVIEKGTMYRAQTDEDTGECFIVRYKIKNWDRMKSGGE
jgi:hypothetical protein